MTARPRNLSAIAHDLSRATAYGHAVQLTSVDGNHVTGRVVRSERNPDHGLTYQLDTGRRIPVARVATVQEMAA